MFQDPVDAGRDLDSIVLELANRGFAVTLSDVDVAHAIIDWIEEKTNAYKPALVAGMRLLAPLVSMSINPLGKTLGREGVRRLRQALLQLPELPDLTHGLNSYIAQCADASHRETRESRQRPPHSAEFGQAITVELQKELQRLQSSRHETDDRPTPISFEGVSNPQPPLALRLVDCTDRSQFFYGSESRPMLGREKELATLDGFLWTERPFTWWLVTGPRGQGKSRLALELCLRNAMTWRVGFLPPSVDFDWRNWKPERPTLLAVEYHLERRDELRAMASILHTSCMASEFPVRLLLIERDLPTDTLNSPMEFAARCMSLFVGEGESRVGLAAAAYQDFPLLLGSLGEDPIWRILEAELSTAVANPPCCDEVISEFQRIDPQGRPLSALLLSESIAAGSGVSNASSLVSGAVNRLEARWRECTSTVGGKDEHAAMDRHLNLLALVTMTGGLNIQELPVAGTEDYLPVPGSPDRERAFDRRLYEAMSCIPDANRLVSLQPDLIGEYFVLDWLTASDEEDQSRGDALLEAAWGLSPAGMFSFLGRVVRGFPDHPSLTRLYRPASRNADQRKRWAAAVGVATYYLGQLRKPIEARSLYDHLTALVEKHRNEPVLRDVWMIALGALSECYLRSSNVSLDSAASLYNSAAPLIAKHCNESVDRKGATGFLANMIAISLQHDDVESARSYHARLLELVGNDSGETEAVQPLILGTYNLCVSLAERNEFVEAVTIFDDLRARLTHYTIGEAERESFAAAVAELLLTFVRARRFSDAHAFMLDLTTLVRRHTNEAALWVHYRSSARTLTMAIGSESDWNAAHALYRDVRDFTKAHPDDEELSRLTFDVGHALIHFFSRTGYFEECKQIYEEQRDFLNDVPHQKLSETHALSTVTLIGARGTKNLETPCKLLDDLQGITRNWRDQQAAAVLHGRGLYNLLSVYGEQGKFTEALVLYEKLAQLARECDDDEVYRQQIRAAWNLNIQCIQAGLDEQSKRVRASVVENQRLRVLAKWELESSGRFTPKRCARCGLESISLKPPGSVFVLSLEKLDELQAFFFGLYDYPRCEACNNQLGEPAAITILLSDGEAFYSAGGTIITVGQLQKMLFDRFEREYSVREVASHNELRRTLLLGFQPRITLLQELVNSCVDLRFERFLNEHWRDLDADFFRFSKFILLLPQVSFGSGWDHEDVLEPLSMMQYLTWMMLCDQWTYEKSDRGESLDQDVVKYIAADGLLSRAVQLWTDEFRKTTAEIPDPSRASYVHHAVNSIICAAASTTNEFSKRWVELFFDFELDANFHSDRVPENLVLSPATLPGAIANNDCWNVYVNRIPIGPAGLTESGKKLSFALNRICEKAGYPYLPEQFWRNISWDYLKKLSDRQLLDVVKVTAQQMVSDDSFDDSDWTFDGFRLFTREVIARDAPALLEELADVITALRGDTTEARISSEVWLGEALREMRRPARFLDRIGREPQAWELELPPGGDRLRLWNERSNALRMVGDRKGALAVIEEAVSEMSENLSDHNRTVILRNRAILLRENGDPASALAQLNELRGLVTARERLSLLDSIFVTQEYLGEYEAAWETLEEALDQVTAYHDVVMWRKLKAQQALLLTVSGEDDEAAAVLIALGSELDIESLIPAASAWANLVHRDQIPENGREILAAVHERVTHEAERCTDSTDVKIADALLKIAAYLSRALQEATTDSLMIRSYEFSQQNNQPTSIFVLAHLASQLYACGALDEAWSISHGIINSLEEKVGRAGDLPSFVASFEWLVGNEFAVLAGAAKEAGESDEGLRFIGELQRDTIGRFRRIPHAGSAGELAILREGLSDASLAKLSFWKGDVAILEWLEVRGFLEGRLTTIRSAGDVEVRSVHFDASLLTLCRRIATRISNWRPGRSGDPFGLEDWSQLETQLREEVRDAAPSCAHVVVIEHGDLSGMPWHVALREWPVSYATSWSSLLQWEQTRTLASAERVAIVTVPKISESESVLTAMRTSAMRTRSLCQELTMRIVTSEGASLDRATVLRMMQTADVSKLICHGFVSYAEREVALMVAHDEQLPLLSAGSRSPRGKQHRLGWHDFAEAEALSPLVFSGAYGSAVAHMFGAGDRLGLFEGLRLGGTRSFVGPKWEMIAASGLSILDDAVENWISGKMNVAEAVHAACKNAEKHVPLWQAWCLAVDGDWKWRNHSRAT